MHSAGEQPNNTERACLVDGPRLLELLERLTEAAALLDPAPDAVVGVKRSGLFPAVYVSERLDLAMFTSSEIASFPAEKFSRPLIVDTTCWSGGSLRSLTRKLEARGALLVRSLVLFARAEPYPEVPGLGHLELSDAIPRFWYTRPWTREH